MKHFNIAILMLVTVGLAGALASGQSVQKGKRVVADVVQTGSAVHPSIADAYAAAASVLRVRVLEGAPVGEGLEKGESVWTQYRCLVLDVLKGAPDLVAGQEVLVRRLGGILDVGDAIRKTSVQDYPDFEPNEEFVLFLSWSEKWQAFTVGLTGTYEIRDGLVVPSDDSASGLGRKHRGRSVDDFVAEIRRLDKK